MGCFKVIGENKLGELLMYIRVVKRIFDIIVSIIALILLLIPFIVIASLIKMESRGSVMFRQNRVGKNGQTFLIFKFRTMRMEAPHDAATNSLENADAMITKVGRFLRKSSIDELPQFINVLKGDMSVIGPRPVICAENELIALRHKNGADKVLPGLTGLAQVHGRDHVPNFQKAQYDGIYAASLSFTTDLKLVIRTIWYVLLHMDIHEGKSIISKKNNTKKNEVMNVKRSKVN